jgi:ATP synthase protein I
LLASLAATTDQADPSRDPSRDASLSADGAGQAQAKSQPAAAAESGPADEYGSLQRRLLLATLLVTLAVTLGSWPLFGAAAARSLLLGGCCGALYLRLLARSVGRIGPDSRSLGRFQILVPALLVIAAARIPAIELLPALAGFVLYKPALLLQAVLAP